MSTQEEGAGRQTCYGTQDELEMEKAGGETGTMVTYSTKNS